MRGRALRVVGVLLVLLVAFGFCAKGAYADGGSFSDEVIYGPDIYNVRAGTWCIQTYSASSFNAALTALGYDPYDSRFTTEVRSYLSDSSQGGSFYQFANAFSNNNNPSHGITIYSVNYTTALDLNNAIYGAEYVYGASYTEDLYNGAKRRVEEVLSGDVGGGGGDSNTPVIDDAYDLIPKVGFVDGNTYTLISRAQGSTFQSIYYNVAAFDSWFTGKKNFVMFSGEVSGNSGYEYISWYLILSLPDGVYPVRRKSDGAVYLYNSTSGNLTYYLKYKNMVTNRNHDTGVFDLATGGSTTTESTIRPGYSQPVASRSYVYTYVYNGVGNPEPVVPPNNWPEDTPTDNPTPPELPTPTDPTLPTQPTDPTGPSDPTFIYQPTYNTNVFTADIQGILDALDEHCQHLQDALYENIKDLNDNLTIKLGNEFSKLRTLIRQQIDWAVESIADCFETLTDNIYDLFHWLADQMDFNFSVEPYNDNSVLYWLRRIYSKLGGGVNTKPVDPVADPFDFWEWLYQLWQNFVVDLIALGADGLGEIAYMLGELIHKFPFSIPWDIAAMLALLVAEPVTPVLQWPMFYYTGSSVVTTTVNIDLSPYDSYVEPVRIMIKIAFAFALAWRTKDMLELLTIARGGND